MSVRIKLKNSVVRDKAPVPADLEIGEVAINAHVDSPSAYIKNSAGAIVKLAGAGSISTPDATAAAKGIVQLADAAAVTAGTAGRVVDAAQLKAVSDADDWTRTGTEISPKVAGDSVFTSGSVKVGGTTAAPNLQIKADGGIVANTNGLVYDAAQKRLGIGTASPTTSLHLGGSSSQTIRINSATSATFVGANGHITQIAGNRNPIDGAIVNTGAATCFLNLEAEVGNGNIQFATTSSNNTGATERVRVDSSGRLLVGASSGSGGALLQVNGDRIRVATAKTPASATDTGVAGEICWDANYVYVCTAANTWKRTAISTW